ncbi:major facilitator superfamily transporter [Phaeosphaeriaceae sp. PMI808]|nr:major facilitator superfamily transporter [Phaeosphaeriaceae sp. PMI808]
MTSKTEDGIEKEAPPSFLKPKTLAVTGIGSEDLREVGNFQSYYLEGWNLQVLNVAICLGLFLATLESTIVSTSLLSITNSLHGFQKSSWIVTSYLLTFTGFLIVIAKLSDIFGRKPMMIFCLLFFIVWPVACGLAQTLVQLHLHIARIVFRALQGIGGGGIYTLTFVILPENISPADYPTYAAIVSSVLAFSSLLGPILGGLICDHASWRWIFFLNAPGGALSLILLWLVLPPEQRRNESITQKVRRIDYLGAFLVLSSTILFVTALEQGGTGFSWHNAIVLAPLIISIILAIGSLLRSYNLRNQDSIQEPVLSWKLLTDRFALGLFLNAFFVGSAFLSSIIVLPQQFQVVYKDTASKSGYRLLCVTLVSPIFSGVAGFLTQKKHIPPLYVLLVGQCLVVIGCGLSSSISHETRLFPKEEYGYQVIMGAGFGLCLSTVVMAAPLAFPKQDMAVGMGTTNQMRNLGGSIGISICANLLSDTLSNRVAKLLSPVQFQSLLGSAESIHLIPKEAQDEVRDAFARSFQRQMYAVTGLGAAGLLCTLIMVERKPRFQQN